jgi:ATP-binding cassette subfamily B protein
MKTAGKRWRHLAQATGLVWRSARPWTLLQGVLVLAQGLLPVASLFLTRQVVDAVGAYLVQTPGAKTPGALLALLPWVAAVVVAGWVLRAGSGIVAEAQAEAVSDHVQGALQEKTAEIDLAYHETAVWHDQMRLAQSEAMTRPVGIVRNLTQLGSGTLVLASVVGVLGASQGVLLPVLLAAAVPGALARVWNSRRWHAWRVAQSPAERQAGYLHLLLTAFPFAKEIRLLGLAGELRRRFAAVRAGLRRSRLALGRRRAGVEIAADAVSALALLGGLGVIYLRLVGNAMTLGDLALLYGGFQKGKAAFGGVLGSLAALYEDSLFIGHFYDFLGLPQQVRAPAVPRPVPRRIVEGFRLEHVSFRYPGSDRDALRDVSTVLRVGEQVALVGENGSAKRRCVNCCAAMRPDRRQDHADAQRSARIRARRVRGACRRVVQGFGRYQMTRRGKRAAGRRGGAAGRSADRGGRAARRRRTGRRAPAAPSANPAGAAVSGRHGTQRGAVATTGPGPGLPARSADPDAGRADQFPRCPGGAGIAGGGHGGSQGQTLFIVSHRLSTVQSADRILLLVDGRLAETGSHAELLQRGGAYSALFALHAREAAGLPSTR